MINSNSNSIHAIGLSSIRSVGNVSAVRGTFQAVMSQLAKQPLKPLSVQQFAGSSRNLALQVQSDMAGIR